VSERTWGFNSPLAHHLRPAEDRGSRSEATGKDRLRYDARMLATFSDWMLGLPSILQVVVAFAVLMAIGATPLLLWLGYAVATTRDAMHADQDRTRT
jgi:hypothetical protein